MAKPILLLSRNRPNDVSPKNVSFEETLETMRSRDCKANIEGYRSEMRLLNSFANPNTFMTMSHSNLERRIMPQREICTTP